jgi:hypothetical protein
MVGAPKAPAGGYGITSLPTTTPQAPASPTPTPGGQPTQPTTGRDNNPVLRSLKTDCFEGHGAKGKGLALGHLKRAAKTEQPTTGTPAEQNPLQKLVGDLQKMIEQLMGRLGQTPTTPAPTTPAPTPAPTTPAPTTPGAL